MTLPPRKIMIGFHGTGQARDALALGELLAGVLHATVVLAQVSPPGHGAAEPERRSGFPGHLGKNSVAVHASSAARGLHDLAITNDAALLVIGSAHGGSLGRVLAGDVLSRLVHSPPCPVAVAPRGYAGHTGGLDTVAVAFDGSDEARLAAADAAELAVAAGATLRLIAVVETSAARYVGAERSVVLSAEEARLSEDVERLRVGLPAGLRSEARVRRGLPRDALLAESEDGVDLLVLGSRGYGPRASALVGSVSARMIRAAQCPLLIVPRGVESRPLVAADATGAHEAVMPRQAGAP